MSSDLRTKFINFMPAQRFSEHLALVLYLSRTAKTGIYRHKSLDKICIIAKRFDDDQKHQPIMERLEKEVQVLSSNAA